MPLPDYYEMLQVSPRADEEVIKVAFGRLAKKYHPDHNPHDPSAERMMKALNEAKEVLLDPVRRRSYDKQREAEQAGQERGREEARAAAEEARRAETEEAARTEKSRRESEVAEASRREPRNSTSRHGDSRPRSQTGRSGQGTIPANPAKSIWKRLGGLVLFMISSATLIISLVYIYDTTDKSGDGPSGIRIVPVLALLAMNYGIGLFSRLL